MPTAISNIITAIITGVFALVGVIFSNMMSNKAIESKLTTAQAVTDEKIDNLTKSIDRHTSSIEKVPVLEHRVDELDKKVEKIETRVNSLDRRKT